MNVPRTRAQHRRPFHAMRSFPDFADIGRKSAPTQVSGVRILHDVGLERDGAGAFPVQGTVSAAADPGIAGHARRRRPRCGTRSSSGALHARVHGVLPGLSAGTGAVRFPGGGCRPRRAAGRRARDRCGHWSCGFPRGPRRAGLGGSKRAGFEPLFGGGLCLPGEAIRPSINTEPT